MKKEKKKIGRPTVFTEEVIAKLEEAFRMDCTDSEASSYADIDIATLYRYQSGNKDFCDKKAKWKEEMYWRARKTLHKGVADKYENAMDYMKRKKKDEFSEKLQQEHTGELRVVIQKFGEEKA